MPLNKDQLCSSKAGSRSAAHHLQTGFLCTTFVFNVPKQTAITQPFLEKQPVNLSAGQNLLINNVDVKMSKCLNNFTRHIWRGYLEPAQHVDHLDESAAWEAEKVQLHAKYLW